jgi:hypothetical protein
VTNIAEIAREAGVSEQNMRHFISNSPWPGSEMIEQVQQAVCDRRELEGGVWIVDESADVKYGKSSAGSSRQHNGRLGKIEQSQVGVYLSYAKDSIWTLIDGELFLPDRWFSKSYAARRNKAEIPLTILASWFIAETRLDWQAEHPRDPNLLDDYETDVLPALSMSNVRDMLRATLPPKQLSPLEAATLVVKHLDNRTRRSRLKKLSEP